MMKKLFILFLILSISITACNQNGAITNDNDITLNNTDINTTSATSQTVTTHDMDGTCPLVQYHFNCSSVQNFVEWIKLGGRYENGDDQEMYNPCSADLLNWRKTQTEISLPILKNDFFKLLTIRVNDNNFYFQYRANEETKSKVFHDRIVILAYTLTEEQNDLSLDELATRLTKASGFFQNVIGKPQSGKSNWGEYRIAATGGEDKCPRVWFVKSSVLYVMCFGNYETPVDTSWHNEYFDYFNFETFSLK